MLNLLFFLTFRTSFDAFPGAFYLFHLEGLDYDYSSYNEFRHYNLCQFRHIYFSINK